MALWTALLLGRAPDAGWFSYTPLAGPTYSPGINVDLYALSISFLEAANLAAALILVITILKMRAPGMAINRMPVFVWSILVVSVMIIFAMPSLMLATIMLPLDRIVGTHFFRIPGGGATFLWQHLFWFFGHPEVYIIAIPLLDEKLGRWSFWLAFVGYHVTSATPQLRRRSGGDQSHAAVVRYG